MSYSQFICNYEIKQIDFITAHFGRNMWSLVTPVNELNELVNVTAVKMRFEIY